MEPQLRRQQQRRKQPAEQHPLPAPANLHARPLALLPLLSRAVVIHRALCVGLVCYLQRGRRGDLASPRKQAAGRSAPSGSPIWQTHHMVPAAPLHRCLPRSPGESLERGKSAVRGGWRMCMPLQHR